MDPEHSQEQLAQFGQAMLDLLEQRCWNSIPKRELNLHLLHHDELEGYIGYRLWAKGGRHNKFSWRWKPVGFTWGRWCSRTHGYEKQAIGNRRSFICH